MLFFQIQFKISLANIGLGTFGIGLDSCIFFNDNRLWFLVEIVPSHEWHLNFSPKLHQWRLSNGLEAIAEGHLRVWTDAIWGEKFKCHECTEQFLINTIKYWQNPFHLEEGKSQISQVWKKTSQFDRRQISNNTGFEKINLFYAT